MFQEQDKAAVQVIIDDLCERVMGECVKVDCVEIAMATLAEAQQEWRCNEEKRMLEEVTKVIAMETEIGVAREQIFQVAVETMRYCLL